MEIINHTVERIGLVNDDLVTEEGIKTSGSTSEKAEVKERSQQAGKRPGSQTASSLLSLCRADPHPGPHWPQGSPMGIHSPPAKSCNAAPRLSTLF